MPRKKPKKITKAMRVVTERHDDMPPTKRLPRPNKRAPRAVRSLARAVRLLDRDAEQLAALGREVGDAGLAEIARGSQAVLLPRLHRAAIAPKAELDTVLEVAKAGARVYASASKASAGLRSAPSGLMLVGSAEEAAKVLENMGLLPQPNKVAREAKLIDIIGKRDE